MAGKPTQVALLHLELVTQISDFLFGGSGRDGSGLWWWYRCCSLLFFIAVTFTSHGPYHDYLELQVVMSIYGSIVFAQWSLHVSAATHCKIGLALCDEVGHYCCAGLMK